MNNVSSLFQHIVSNLESYLMSPHSSTTLSPLSESDTLDSPGKLNYVAVDRAKQAAAEAAKAKPQKEEEQPLHYPDWMANSSKLHDHPAAKAVQESHLSQSALEKMILAGFTHYGAPAATAAASFAKAGEGLPDPLMPAVLALKETSGGKRMAPNSANNLLNIGPNINYPSIDANLNGGGTWGRDGGPQGGFTGTIHSPAYAKYLQTGDLHDFFAHYTPTNDANGNQVNGKQDEQINQYNLLRSYFSNPELAQTAP